MKRKWIIASILILAEILLCAGIVFIAWKGINQIGESGNQIRLFNIDLVSAKADQAWDFAVDGPTTLIIESSAGDIDVTKGDGKEVNITAQKTAWGTTSKGAENSLENMSVQVLQDGNTITVRYQSDFKMLSAVSRVNTVDFTIRVPSETTVNLVTDTGDIDLSETTGEADLDTKFGDITVNDVEGRLLVNTNSGKITAGGIQAGSEQIDLNSEFGDIRLEDSAAGEVKANSGSGSLDLDKVAASGEVNITSRFGDIEYKSGSAEKLTAETNSGKVQLTGLTVEGLVFVKSEFGDILMTQVSGTSYDLNTNSGVITLDRADGPVIANSGFGDIAVSNAGDAGLDLKTKSGEIKVSDTGGTIKAETGFGDIEITSTEATDLDLFTESGTIAFTGPLGAGPHYFETEFGDIRLQLPEEVAIDFDLETGFGDIRSDFQVTISGDIEEDHWKGAINDGGTSLTAKTKNGNIDLEFIYP
jgi:DUF4097 and DUF4098 domain-containing protein YvlB